MLLARAQAHYDQGALAESVSAFDKALALLESIPPGSEESDLVLNLQAVAHNGLALTYAQAGRFDDARAQNGVALAAFRRVARGGRGEP